MRKNKATTECDKRIVTCDVGTAQCEDRTIKYDKKNKGITECNKKNVTCEVETAQLWGWNH